VIFGWAGNPALPDGVFYEGVAKWEGHGQKFRGETGAQSAIIPSLDAALGVRFLGDEEFAEHLLQLRDYMPPKHRAFVERLEEEEHVSDAGTGLPRAARTRNSLQPTMKS